jgi:hypothetical protein
MFHTPPLSAYVLLRKNERFTRRLLLQVQRGQSKKILRASMFNIEQFADMVEPPKLVETRSA